MPKVSVIVPNFNEERFISYTLESLLAQTFKQFECIIVDDASTDSSLEVCKKILNGDSRFRIVRHMRNSKLPAARNTGLLCSSGKYVVFLDADDMLSPTCLAQRLEFMENNNFNFAAGCYGKHEGIPEYATKPFETKRGSFPDITFQRTLGDNPFVVHSAFVKSKIVRGIGGFDESFVFGAEDFDLWLKILRHGYMFLSTNMTDAFYRAKEKSMVRASATRHLEISIGIMERSNTLIDNSYFYDLAYMKMYRPAYEYQLSERYIKRILNFFGMILPFNTSIRLVDFSRYISDVAWNFPLYVSPVDEICYGLRRSLPEADINQQILEKLLPLIEYNICELKEYVETHTQIPDASPAPLYSAKWQREVDMFVFVASEVDVAILKSIAPLLHEAGISFVVCDPSALSETISIREYLKNTDLPYLSLPRMCFGDFAPKFVLSLNANERIINFAMKAAEKCGISSAIVAGYSGIDNDFILEQEKARQKQDSNICSIKFNLIINKENIELGINEFLNLVTYAVRANNIVAFERRKQYGGNLAAYFKCEDDVLFANII